MRIIFFGPPGAGKGTQAKLLSSYLDIPHLSTGEILRSKLNDSDELSNKLKHVIKSGSLKFIHLIFAFLVISTLK